MTRSVPLRRSLLVRLLAASILIALCSIAATAWLAVQTTTRVIQQEQGQALSDDAKIYDGLIGYAATHRSWAGVEPTVAQLADRTGRQITLTTMDRVPITSSRASSEPLPQKEFAVVDPLNTDPGLQPQVGTRIDPRVRGPYQLSAAGWAKQWAAGLRVTMCFGSFSNGGYPLAAQQNLAGYITVSVNYSGTIPAAKIDPTFEPGDPAGALIKCGADQLPKAAPADARALAALSRSVGTCLTGKGRDPALPTRSLIGTDGKLLADPGRATPITSPDPVVQRCLDAGQRQQFRSYVAPAALVFVRTPAGAPQARFNFSSANLVRIIGVAAGVLAIAVALTVLLGARLVRPLRALTIAAQHPTENQARVPVARQDEIGLLAVALNTSAERRERAEQQRTVMVSDVAHELRTPLTNIRSWLEAVQDGLSTPASDPALTEALLGEALQLQAIIDDLQDLAMADAAGLRLTLESVPIGDLLDQITAAHRPQAEAAGVRLSVDATDGLALPADPVRLRQAVGNLVANAIRYTPAGASVSLTARREGETVVISVADEGVGIAAEDLPHVFDRFWRVDRSRSRDSGGSGLGLAIVRQIAEAHGGTVTATSSVGDGSCFSLRLPGAE